MNYTRVLSACPLLGGLSSFGVSFIRGFTIARYSTVLISDVTLIYGITVGCSILRLVRIPWPIDWNFMVCVVGCLNIAAYGLHKP